METENEQTIRDKLARMSEYIDKLEPIAARTFDEYQQDYFVKHTAERLIELIVECAVDINNILITEHNGQPADTYYGSFIRMGELNILTRELSVRLAPLTGLRNRLAHEYEDVRDDLVYQNVRVIQQLLPQYMTSIGSYIGD